MLRQLAGYSRSRVARQEWPCRCCWPIRGTCRCAAWTCHSALSLAAAFWPGSLTLVLRRSDAVPDIVAAGGATVAVRVPDHPVPREIARRLGSPITGTSANLSGLPPATTAAEVREQVGDRVDYVLEGGSVCSGVPSTVLDLTGPEPVIVRQGAVAPEAIGVALGTEVAVVEK